MDMNSDRPIMRITNDINICCGGEAAEMAVGTGKVIWCECGKVWTVNDEKVILVYSF